MTRTDVMASSRPRTAGMKTTTGGLLRIRRGLLLLPVIALLAMTLTMPGVAVAASGEPTSGYNQKPEEGKEKTGPSKETEKPAEKEKPAEPSSEEKKAGPSSGTEPATEKSSTLPFTGLDLRWTLAAGILLMGAGFGLVTAQRRQRR